MSGLMQPGPTLYEAEERRKKRGSQGLLEAVGEPLSYAPGVTGLLGNALLGARMLTGEQPVEEGLSGLAMMTGLLQGTKVAPIMQNAYKAISGIEKGGRWNRENDTPKWEQNHEELVSNAVHSWKGWPTTMLQHMDDYKKTGQLDIPSGSGKQMRAQSAALLHELENNSKLNSVPLYRGSSGSRQGFSSFTESKKVAESFAKKHGGTVETISPNSVKGLRISDYINDQAEKEWIVDVSQLTPK